MITIKLTNKVAYTIIVVLAILSLSLGAYAYNSGGPPSVVGHSAEEIELSFSQSLNCINKRSAVFKHDSVMWCDSVHPTLVQCSLVDDEAPATSPTIMTSCLTDGDCDARGIRIGLGADAAYLETVKQNTNGGIMGCWQYDEGHTRNAYKLDIICCE